MRVRVVSTVVLLALGVATAWAGKGISRLRGQILVSDEPIPTLNDEATMVDVLKKWQRSAIDHDKGSGTWSFHMMSFPSQKPGVTSLSLLFYDVSGAKPAYLTSKTISCDAGATILASDINVDQADGVKPGMKVELFLSRFSGRKQTDLARTKLTFK